MMGPSWLQRPKACDDPSYPGLSIIADGRPGAGKRKNVFYGGAHKTRFFLAPPPDRPSAVMDSLQREVPSSGPSRIGANPNRLMIQ